MMLAWFRGMLTGQDRSLCSKIPIFLLAHFPVHGIQGSYGPWKSWKTLENFWSPGNPWKPWKSPGIFFMKPWKISQNFIEKINSSNGAFSGLNNKHLKSLAIRASDCQDLLAQIQRVLAWPEIKRSQFKFWWFCFYGYSPYWWWISMCMANVVLASWFPVGACLYCNMWSYYFRTLNGFSFGKYFFQTYFPWQKRFNK